MKTRHIRPLLLVVIALLPRVVGARTLGMDVSANQGNMNWATAYDNHAVRFAFIRATRGPSSGSFSVNDTEFSDNVTLLHNLAVGQNKVIYNGFYHYGRPDLIAVQGAQPSNTTVINSAQDEAQHFFNVVGPQYASNGADVTRRLRPVLDLEERGGSTGQDPLSTALTQAKLSLWADSFLNKFETLTGGVRPLLYMNGSYATSNVDNSLSDENLWVANWNTPSTPQTGNPASGVFPTWSFWQYDSPNGLGTSYGSQGPPIASADIDLDVANGDINFVRSFLIPEPTGATMVLALCTLGLARRRRVALSTPQA